MSGRLVAGAVGGVAGGVVFGAMMQAIGMISMIGALVGTEGVAAGWVVHLVISAAIGAGYGVTFGARDPGYRASAGLGLLYGGIWWVLGPLLLMPLLLGMGAFPPIGQGQMMSLVGHLVFGLVLGLVYVVARERTPVSSERELQSH